MDFNYFLHFALDISLNYLKTAFFLNLQSLLTTGRSVRMCQNHLPKWRKNGQNIFYLNQAYILELPFNAARIAYPISAMLPDAVSCNRYLH